MADPLDSTPERIDRRWPEDLRRGHELRYHLAAGFCRPGDVVLDVACGTGYGSEIVNARGDLTYVGVDRIEDFESDGDASFISADLGTWRPGFEYDVALSFETIEHLHDYSNLVEILKGARRWVLASVPVVPTTHTNRHHVHDFEPGELADLLGSDWCLFQMLQQPAEVAEIYVWKRGRGRSGRARHRARIAAGDASRVRG